MNTKYAVLAGLVIVALVVGIFGAHFGYTVQGVPRGSDRAVPEDEPGIITALVYAFDCVGFLVLMIFFQVDGVPVWLSSVFLFMGLMTLVLLASLVRGTQ